MKRKKKRTIDTISKPEYVDEIENGFILTCEDGSKFYFETKDEVVGFLALFEITTNTTRKTTKWN